MRRIVARSDPGQLIEGLQRLRVVGINLDEHEDPQQIFESLNATGRPLTESEKVKNWLLMGLPDAEQQDLHDNYWLVMEQALGAEHGSEPTDIFLRDLLRWRTGELVGIDRVYENQRRWLAQNGKNHGDVGDRVALLPRTHAAGQALRPPYRKRRESLRPKGRRRASPLEGDGYPRPPSAELASSQRDQ